MSTLSELRLFDTAVLTALVRGYRAANGDPEALLALVRGAEEPRLSKALAAQRRKTLARLVELDAPATIVENARREVEPRALLLERLGAGGSFAEWELHALAERGRRDIPETYTVVEWLADHEARRRGPTPEMTEGFVAGFRATTPAVSRALFGDGPLLVDDAPTIGDDRAWVLDEAQVAATLLLCEALVRTSPPPLADYRRWYAHLHAMEFTIDETRAVPEDGPLAWEYARALTKAANTLAALTTMLRTCARRGWCVQVVYE